MHSDVVPQTSISDNKRTAHGAHIAWNECDNSLFHLLTPVMTYLWVWFKAMYLQVGAAKRWCFPPQPSPHGYQAVERRFMFCAHTLEHEDHFYSKLLKTHGWLWHIHADIDRLTIGFSKMCFFFFFLGKWSEYGIWEFCTIARKCTLLTLKLETLFQLKCIRSDFWPCALFTLCIPITNLKWILE